MIFVPASAASAAPEAATFPPPPLKKFERAFAMELQVLLEHLVQRPIPLAVGVLAGHHDQSVLHVDPSVVHGSVIQVHVLDEIHREAGERVVDHVVPGLLDVPEHVIGDEHSVHQMGVRVQVDQHPPRGMVERLHDEPGYERPGYRRQQHRPVLGQDVHECIRTDDLPYHVHDEGSGGDRCRYGGDLPPGTLLRRFHEGLLRDGLLERDVLPGHPLHIVVGVHPAPASVPSADIFRSSI